MVVNLARSVRSLALKIASYGVMHLVVAMIVAFAITRDWRMALAIGVVEPFFQTIAYSFHDRVWHRIERRRMGSSIEETAEAFTARLERHGRRGTGAERAGTTATAHALPSFKQIAHQDRDLWRHAFRASPSPSPSPSPRTCDVP